MAETFPQFERAEKHTNEKGHGYETSNEITQPAKTHRRLLPADQGDSEAVSRCFTENAVVKDEGHTHNGRAAIKAWKTDASAKYQYTCEPFACEENDGKTVVTCHLVGNFPGSPVDLRFFFGLEGDKIALLEVVP